FFRRNPKYDYGVHSTLTSEWKFYRWSSVSSKDKVTSLLDEEGYLWRSAEAAARAKVEEIKNELETQVKRSFNLGLRPSHLDTHMGVVYLKPEILESYIKVALNNNLIPMLVKPSSEVIARAKEAGLAVQEIVKIITSSNLPLLDNLITGTEGSNLQERLRWFRSVLSKIKPGTINQIIVHLGLDDEELKAITPSYMERYLDYKLVTSDEAKKLVEEYKITLVGWKDLSSYFKAKA
ncbi:MAG: ChbG/HpnK family deacetylase, partial [Thermoproteota archaeon]